MPIPAFASDRYLRIVRASGWYDLLVTWPFACPGPLPGSMPN